MASGQLDMFAELEAAETAERAQAEVRARMAAAGDEVIDTVVLAALCRRDADRLDARDADDRARFGPDRAGFFRAEAERLRVLAAWLDQRGGGRVPVERAGWLCTRCDAEPGVMCGVHSVDGTPFVHVGRGFLIGFTAPGAGWTSSETPGPQETPSSVCAPSCEDGPGRAWRGRCLGCRWRGPIREEENTAVEDAHDHTHPGWRRVPVVDPAPNVENPRDRRITRWTQQTEQAVAEAMGPDWLPAGGPIRTRRDRPASRHVPGRAPGGGYDLSAPSDSATS